MHRGLQTTTPVTAILIIALAGWSVSGTFAQSTGPTRATDPKADITISDANFAIVAQQIRELKNPTFRALLRARLVGWKSSGDNAQRREDALSVTTEALSD